MDVDDNWLHLEKIECLNCKEELCIIDHSPMIDAYYFYCDSCPIYADVSYYDPLMEKIQAQFSSSESNYLALMEAIQVRLKPCRCGGRFRHDSPRRCFTCNTPVMTEDTSGIDIYLWKYWGDEEAITANTAQEEEKWLATYIRSNDLWLI